MSSIPGSSDDEKLANLTNFTYKEQAVWFLNAFWNNPEVGEKEAERLWGYVQKCGELDANEHEEGHGLDEMQAHVLLECHGETLTVREMRAKLRETGAIGEKERPKTVPLVHYLLFRYNVSWRTMVNAIMGDNQEELAKAQAMLEAAQAACTAAQEAERAAKAAQKELEAALAELHAQEEAYNQKTEQLKAKSETGGVVSRGKAKNELAQHLAEDPLPLRRAKLTTEAAKKRADKAAAAAEEALSQAKARFAEAEAYLEEVKAQGGSAEGSIWWMERELHESKKYLPTSRGGIAK